MPSVVPAADPADAVEDALTERLPPESKRRACLIFNPASGGAGHSSEVWSALREVGIWAEMIETTADEPATGVARRAAESGRFDLVIAAGGDGTVAEVAKGLVGTEACLGVLAQGTFNNFSRALGLPANETKAGCAVLGRGRVRRVDVGRANGEHLFFEAAGVGLDAPLFPLGEELKESRWYSPRPLWRALRLLTGFQPVRVNFEMDRALVDAYVAPLAPLRPGTPVPVPRHMRGRRLTGAEDQREFDLRAFLVVAANGPYYGSGFTVAPGAVLDDGLFTVSVFRRFSKLELIRHFLSISRGRRRYTPKIDTFRAARLRLTSRVPLGCHVDGHPIGTVPLELEILPRALKVIA